MFEEMTPKQKDALWIGGGIVLATIIAIVVHEKTAAAAPAAAVTPVPAPTPVPVAPPTSSGTYTLLPNSSLATSITSPMLVGASINASITLALPTGATWTSLAVAASTGGSYSYVPVTGSTPYTFTYTGPGIATAVWTDSTGTLNTTYISFYTVLG